MAVVLTALSVAGSLSAEPFTNDSVIALTKADLGETVLLAKVNSLPCGYDVSTAAILRLNAAGVPKRVIAAMVERCAGSVSTQGGGSVSDDPLVPRSPGLYVALPEASRTALRVIHPTAVSGVRIAGNGSVVFPYIAKLDVPRPGAEMHVGSASPVFYFYFEPTDRKVGDFGAPATHAAQSPSEFSLVRFSPKNGVREMTIGKVSRFNIDSGIDPRSTIAFSSAEVGNSIFKVEMQGPLAAGEYGFVLVGTKGSYRIYDFAVGADARP